MIQQNNFYFHRDLLPYPCGSNHLLSIDKDGLNFIDRVKLLKCKND